MKLTIERETLLKPLQLIAGVVERRQTLPILANVLFSIKKQELTLTGTDLEVELQGRVDLQQEAEVGTITVPARKLMDICRALPEQSELEISLEGARLMVRSGRSRFNLVTLPATDFPATEQMIGQLELTVPQAEFRKLIDDTCFAMAQQDVRYYLNGLLLEVSDNCLRAVATDGHRLAFSSIEGKATGLTQVIIPRKAVLELARLLADSTDNLTVTIGANHLRVKAVDYTFTSKLIDGRFPAYEKIIPQNGDKSLIIDKDTFKQMLMRVATLANEKHRGVRMELRPDLVRIVANNPEQEEAEEELSVDYRAGELDIGFNVNYLLDAISVLPSGDIKLTMAGPDSSVRIESAPGGSSLYVVMPMRL